MTRVMIIDDSAETRTRLAEPLRRTGHDVHETSSRIDALRMLRASPCDVVFAGSAAPREPDHTALIAQILALSGATNVVVVSAAGTIEEAVAVIKAGATDYLQLPVDPNQVVRRLHETRHDRWRAAGPQRQPSTGAPVRGRFVAADSKTQRLFDRTRRVAEVDCTVLITGESGTGKEVIAWSIFEQSRRHSARFVALNCGAVPDTLIESELFGHHKGAFTGATSDKPGLVEEADGGVLFLDEIGEMSPRFQATLLRFLDHAELRRVGDTTLRRVNARIIAATNRRLEHEVRRGAFREDLYYRLSVVSLHVPPLRERPEDIPALATHFLFRAAAKFQKDIRTFSQNALARLRQHDWPGNVRELQNVIEGAVALTEGTVVDVDFLPGPIVERRHRDAVALETSELTTVTAVLERCRGNQTQAAAALGVSRSTLWRKLRRMESDRGARNQAEGDVDVEPRRSVMVAAPSGPAED